MNVINFHPNCRYSQEIVTERHVQALWYDDNMRPEILLSKSCEDIRVVDPGEWNLGAGPDFLNAVLEIGPDRKRVRGDVEIHLRPSDWTAHKHSEDAAYNNVIAHITWHGGAEPATLPRGAIAVCIGRHMVELPGFSPEQIDLSAYPYSKIGVTERKCSAYLKDRPDLARSVLVEAGEHRIYQKAGRLENMMSDVLKPETQLFYEEVMVALGYGGSSRAFRKIAEMVPYSRLVAEPDNALNALVAASGFVDWPKRSGRPNNSPLKRLLSVPELFEPARLKAIMDSCVVTRADCKAVIALLTGDGLMGKGRAAAILSNVIVPWNIATGRIYHVPEWLPPEDISAPVRLTACRLFGRDHNPSAIYASNNVCVQGLVQIHREECLRYFPECDGCTLLARLPSNDAPTHPPSYS